MGLEWERFMDFSTCGLLGWQLKVVPQRIQLFSTHSEESLFLEAPKKFWSWFHADRDLARILFLPQIQWHFLAWLVFWIPSTNPYLHADEFKWCYPYAPAKSVWFPDSRHCLMDTVYERQSLNKNKTWKQEIFCHVFTCIPFPSSTHPQRPHDAHSNSHFGEGKLETGPSGLCQCQLCASVSQTATPSPQGTSVLLV